MTSHKKFNHDYFENGVEKGISLYENYRWMPEVSLPIADFIKQNFDSRAVLDYGCAKGFLVYAMRLLDIIAYGYDFSEYALDNCHPDVKDCLSNDKSFFKNRMIDLVIVKDVFEHLDYQDLDTELQWIHEFDSDVFVAVPFGENNRYRISEYGFDKTHIIKENEEWWIKKFIKNGFTIDRFCYKMESIKRNWHNHHEYGNGFFFLKSR